MKFIFKNGSTSNILRVLILDSTSTTGAGKTGLTEASSGLIIATIANNEATATVYTQAAGNVETITTLGTFSAPSANKARFKEVDATNLPGVYEIQIADARFAVASAKALVVMVLGVSGIVPCTLEIELITADLFDSVRLGLTALPNAAAEAAGGLYTRGTGAGQINQPANGMVDVNAIRHLGTAYATPTFAGVPEVDVTHWRNEAVPATLVTGTPKVDSSHWQGVAVATPSIPGVPEVDVTYSAGSLVTGGTPDVNVISLSAGALTSIAAGVWNALTSGMSTVGSIGKRIVDYLTGDIYARVGAPVGASISADIATVLAKLNNGTDGLGAIMTSVTNLTGNVTASLMTPKVYERPDTGSKTYRILLHLFDDIGNYEDPDTNLVTFTAQNDQGTDRSSNLSSVTRDAAGQYRVDYTVASTHAIEGVTFLAAWTEAAVAQGIGGSTHVVELTAQTFTSADRTKLDTLHDTRIPGVIQPQTGDSFARLGTPVGASISSDIAGIQSDTDNIQTRIPAALVSGRMASNAEVVGDKTGYALSSAGVQAIWDALTSALTTVGSIGKKLADWVVGTIDTYTGNTKQTGDAFARLGAPAGASIAADIADTATAAEVAVEVADALRTDSGAEVATPPAKDAPIAAQLQWLFQAMRNGGIETLTSRKTLNDAGTVTGTQSVSDANDQLTVGKAT
jgi:hypothetical protein